MRKGVLLSLLSLLFLAALAAAGPGREGRPRNIILIGWDGAQRAHVKECLARGELPNLARLAAEGTIVAIDVLRVTDTKAGWAQILTGYEPEVTGVYSNGRYGPIPPGLTVFERLEEYFGPERFATVAVIGKKGNVDADPPEKVEPPTIRWS
ncbi:MAG: alkaline phosphatase family protein [Firmicutes bacterium]|nr:alkaline phosphatase family protein [Bacillota bacterium]